MEERFDEFDEYRRSTGRTVSRAQAHRDGLWHQTAHLWLTDGKGQLLLQQRHPSKETDPGRWDIAVAGHVSAGQTPLEALMREAREELGLVLDPDCVTGLGVCRKEYLSARYRDREWQHAFAGVWSGLLDTLVLQAEEVVSVRWLDFMSFRRAMDTGDTTFVDRSEDWPAFEAWISTGF